MGDPVESATRRGATLQEVVADATPILTRIAERLCGRSADASDLVQDTAERAMRQGLPADVVNPRAWLTKMMHNLFLDRCRTAARAPVHEQFDDVRDAIAPLHSITPLHSDTSEPAWSDVTIEEVRAAAEQIDAPYREVYILHAFEAQSYEAIAARLNICRITVGTRLTRARKMLRRELVKRVGRARP